ncbi:MAG TPA: hypothetical protein DDY98_05855 [Ruminococcaceae bacterium]|nr:hypothetical protein [Oscillospiraceae bacterium]
MRIAVADDEELLLIYLVRLLNELLPDAEIDSFSGASVLLESAKIKQYDIVFLDIQMPGMTGVDLAGKLKTFCPKLNIIFVTGYDGYQGDAMNLFASGYIRKPATKEKLRVQLNNLRYPIEKEGKRVFAQTFGSFTLFADGKPVRFKRKKSQQLIAYLVHRRGSVISRKELSSVLFDDGVYDANRISYISKLCADVQTTLNELDVTDLVQSTPSGLSINVNALDCDLYDMLNGKSDAAQKYNGEYMAQYEFGEETVSALDQMFY